MKKLLEVARCCVAAALLPLAASAARAAMPIEHWEQPGGAQIWLVQSMSIPMLDVQIDFDAGSRRDSAAQAGLAEATALMVQKGVAAHGAQGALDENQIGEAWADLGASFDVDADVDRMSFRLRTLTDAELLPKAIALAARQLGRPSFPQAVWRRERERLIAAQAEARTRPGVVAHIAYNHAVYGAHPYGYETTAQTLAAINAADLKRFYVHHIQPCRAKISVVGAITREQADALVARLLADFPPGTACATPAPVPEVAPLAAPQNIAIAFQSAQAHILMGQPGYRRDDADHLALNVGNYILGGGGFVSRLMTEVREKRGLSYSVYSQFAPGLNAGAFTISLQTRPDQADQALAIARQTLAGFVQNGPTEAELKAAQDNLVNGFALMLDSNSKLLSNVANIAWHNLPLDYLDTWSDKVRRITAADVAAAIARKLQPENMVTVVVGGSGGDAATPAKP
ncbi:MAG: insulinase family protein [Burkholderiaceae bacterium]|nr:insulinase family protein [Burkholderiaceae bacterium]